MVEVFGGGWECSGRLGSWRIGEEDLGCFRGVWCLGIWNVREVRGLGVGSGSWGFGELGIRRWVGCLEGFGWGIWEWGWFKRTL